MGKIALPNLIPSHRTRAIPNMPINPYKDSGDWVATLSKDFLDSQSLKKFLIQLYKKHATNN
jgi:hypothetical protein